MKNRYILFLDDTKANSQHIKSQVLKNEVISYSGIFVDEQEIKNLEYVVLGLIENLKQRFNETEFHFTNIYNRKSSFKDININETMEIVEVFVQLIKHFDLFIFTQTYSNSILEKDNGRELDFAFQKLCEKLKIKKNPKTSALFLTYFMAEKELKELDSDGELLGVVCDEGLFKPKVEIKLGENNDGVERKIIFEDSKFTPLLQVADFVAWAITREKNILQKDERSEVDKRFLKIMQELLPNYVNLPKFEIGEDEIIDYDKKIDEQFGE